MASILGAGACKKKAENTPADNTAQNQRDKNVVPTADQAGQNKSDIDVAQQVRKAIVGDGSLSTNAHNCKVIVKDGVVTLTGPVASADEKTKIDNLATGVAGVTKVVNQLDIAN
ncbi:MAG TPA: BON domain-containing protein [Kofleriaceae bacterium]|nr:BON domain-containing protein [Kofleriaceae bacterium]